MPLALGAALASACGPTPTAPEMQVEMHSVTAEALTLRVTAPPGTLVSHMMSDETPAVVGPEGFADLSIPRAEAPRYFGQGTGTNGGIYAFEESLFGAPERMHSRAHFNLPFDIRYLAGLSLPAQGSWARVVAIGGSEERCLQLREPGAPQPGGLGETAIGDGPNTFFAPAGTEVTLGPLQLTVAESGLQTMTVDPVALLAWVPVAEEETTWPIRVESPGQAPFAGESRVELLAGCRSALHGALSAAVADGRPWPSTEGEPGAFTLFLDRDRAVSALGDPAEGARMADASFLAIEEVTESVPDERECHVHRDANYVYTYSDGRVSDDSVDIDRTPVRHTTQVSIYRTSDNEQVATREFRPPSRGCEENFYPNPDAVRRWARRHAR